jgi:hypothetical protein
MSFKIDDKEWEPQTAEEHSSNIMQTVNSLLEQNGIKDDSGNIVSLKQNYGNAFYLLCLAIANRIADNDAKLSKAINSFNVSLCDDTQIENLLPIAAVTRNPGSYSTLVLSATASENGSCTIPAGTKAPFEDVNFIVKTDVLIEAGKTQNIETVCDTVGPITVLTGEINAFSEQIVNLEKVTNGVSSIPGTSPETTNNLRKRIVQGNTIKYTLDGCKSALEELTGINYAKVFFNYNTDKAIILSGNISLAPRHAYIVIDGSSDKLAETYSEYMNAPTQNGSSSSEYAKSQNYVTGSGQEIPIKYDLATEQYIYAKIWLEENADEGTQVDNQLKRDLITASASWGIGTDVNAKLIIKPFVDINYTNVAYCEVSLDGNTWSNHIEIGANVIPRIKDENILVETLV